MIGSESILNVIHDLLVTRKRLPALTLLILCIGNVLGQTQYIVNSGDTANLSFHLRTKKNCTIVLQGSYNLKYPLAMTNANNVTIEGSGAIWNLLNGYSFKAVGSQRIQVQNLRITDLSTQSGEVFAFEGCSFCGVQEIKFTATNSVKNFAKFSKGSINGFVKNCDIDKAYSGVQLGIGGPASTSLEPADKPTSGCVIEGNRFTNFVTRAVCTRSRNDSYSPNSEDSKLRHIIRGNMIRNPNINNSGCGASPSLCFVGIEVWGNEVLVEDNTIEGNPNGNSNIGILFKQAYRSTCRNNRIKGPFTTQGISLFSVNNSTIAENIIESIPSQDYYSGGLAISAESTSPVSEENIISGNQIISCRRAIYLERSNNNRISGNTIRSSDVGVFSTGCLFTLTNNNFLNNVRCINEVGGPVDGLPIHISGNNFENTSQFVFNNETLGGDGRPIIFESNRVYGWGDPSNQTFRAALFLRCGPSKISNNTFVSIAGGSSQVAAAKSVGYSSTYSYMNIVTDNLTVNSSLTLSNIPSGFDNAPLNSTSGWFISPDFLNGNYP